MPQGGIWQFVAADGKYFSQRQETLNFTLPEEKRTIETAVPTKKERIPVTKIFWKSDYSVNSQYIDHQHQKLLGIVNDFNEALAAGKGEKIAYSLLNRLVQYAEEHFRDEEKLMRMARYPTDELDRHIKEHEKLTEEIFQHTENWSSYRAESLPRIGEFLKKWLLDHILTSDKKYAQYVVHIDNKYLSVK
ncbi:MAG: hypothetical protein BM485_05875 [Desulfobulbaceae bacterium DB1]|nr:MAG: hypothetical protein BM485_05875 [Desulfobulbaceae bacterium DB1]